MMTTLSPQEHLASLKQAASQDPDNINHWIDLCECAEQQRNYSIVLHAGSEIVRLSPSHAAAHFIRGLALFNLERHEEAIHAYKQTLLHNPDYIDAWVNLGTTYQSLNRLDEAEIACREAIRASGQIIDDEKRALLFETSYGSHHWNLAILELLKGDLINGFARYRSRYQAFSRPQPSYDRPLWNEEDLYRKKILITAEQGYGDTLLMARYLPLLKERGAHVIFLAQSPLIPYLKDWEAIDEIYEKGTRPLPSFDFYAGEFDLPRIFKTRLETIPAQTPYLPPALMEPKNILPPTAKLKVALTWSGFPNHANDRKRSVPLMDLLPLFSLDNVQFIVLNRDKRPGDNELLATLPVMDVSSRLANFSDSADFIEQCDLVISCDTSVAHLAGGMGKPFWLMLPFAPSWVWMTERTDSPWYPSAHLFRQKNPGNWSEIVNDMRETLIQL